MEVRVAATRKCPNPPIVRNLTAQSSMIHNSHIRRSSCLFMRSHPQSRELHQAWAWYGLTPIGLPENHQYVWMV